MTSYHDIDAPALVPAYVGSAADALARAFKVCSDKKTRRRIVKIYNMAADLCNQLERRP